MKTGFFAPAVCGVALLLATVAASAQSNFVLHTFGTSRFSGGVNGVNTNGDGVNPSGWLTPVSSTLYGTAVNGGLNGAGVLFSFNTNGAFNVVYTFPADVVSVGNSVGANPNGGMVWSNGLFYGTATSGGGADQGTIFSINTNGTGIQNLHSFSDASLGTNSDGANPAAGLIVSGANLYGTAPDGGLGGNGVVFAFNINTKALTVLHPFTAGNTNFFGTLTNSDGAKPTCNLILSGTTLYGTTSAGGTNGYGTIFSVSTNGGGFSVLHHFDVNAANPASGVVLSGGTLFGIGGTVLYRINANGTGYSVLSQFDSQVDSASFSESGLTVSNGTLYGVAASAGFYGYGQTFAVNTNGAGFSVSHDFTLPLIYPTPATNSDGIFPSGGLVLINSSLYGAASGGGTNGSGLLFKSPPPPAVFSSQRSGQNLILNLQTFAGMSYSVQQNTNLAGTNWITFTNFAGDSLLKQIPVTTANSSRMFYRARQP